MPGPVLGDAQVSNTDLSRGAPRQLTDKYPNPCFISTMLNIMCLKLQSARGVTGGLTWLEWRGHPENNPNKEEATITAESHT